MAKWGVAGGRGGGGAEADEGLVRGRVIGELAAASVVVVGSVTGAPHIDEAAEGEGLRPVRGTRVDRGGELARGRGRRCWVMCARRKGRATRRVGMPIRGVGVEREHAGLNRQGGTRAERVALRRGWLTRWVCRRRCV